MTAGEVAGVASLAVAAFTALGVIIKAIIDSRAPADANRTAASSAANDLILKLLDRADKQVELYGRQIEQLQQQLAARPTSETAALLAEVRADRDQVELERDRLRRAIEHLRRRAEKQGSVTYEEVVVWAANALDVNAPLQEDDLADIGSTQSTTTVSAIRTGIDA